MTALCAVFILLLLSADAAHEYEVAPNGLKPHAIPAEITAEAISGSLAYLMLGQYRQLAAGRAVGG
jgi:hypothetical protein